MSIDEIRLQGYVQSSDLSANSVIISTFLAVGSLAFLASYM